MSEVRHSIKWVAKRTGLSAHVIRAWEKRYGTVRPQRTDGNRRYYTPADVERLLLLRQATESGHSIGDIAALDTERLALLLAGEARSESPFRLSLPSDANAAGSSPESQKESQQAFAGYDPRKDPGQLWLDQALAAVLEMDARQLEAILEKGLVAMGPVRLIRDLIVPLVSAIGEGWRRGELKVAHEHVASAVLRTFLGQVARPIALHPSAPGILATTPAGQLHELGAILVAATAAQQGWRVVYGGASLPAEDIVAVATHNRVRLVALSLIHPADDVLLPDELRRLRRLLPGHMAILVGGRASGGYRDVFDEIGAIQVTDLENVETLLQQFREGTGMGVRPLSHSA